METLKLAADLAARGEGEAACEIRRLYDKLQETERRMRELNRELYRANQTNIYLRQELGCWK